MPSPSPHRSPIITSLAKASLLAGKHTLVEKPLAASSAECEELIEIADEKGVVLMSGHTFSTPLPCGKSATSLTPAILAIFATSTRAASISDYFQKDINVVWDLAPHDISIILHILAELPLTVNCQGNAHVTAGVEDVTNLSAFLPQQEIPRPFKVVGWSRARFGK